MSEERLHIRCICILRNEVTKIIVEIYDLRESCIPVTVFAIVDAHTSAFAVLLTVVALYT